jgi:hypothetical protein
MAGWVLWPFCPQTICPKPSWRLRHSLLSRRFPRSVSGLRFPTRPNFRLACSEDFDKGTAMTGGYSRADAVTSGTGRHGRVENPLQCIETKGVEFS